MSSPASPSLLLQKQAALLGRDHFPPSRERSFPSSGEIVSATPIVSSGETPAEIVSPRRQLPTTGSPTPSHGQLLVLSTWSSTELSPNRVAPSSTRGRTEYWCETDGVDRETEETSAGFIHTPPQQQAVLPPPPPLTKIVLPLRRFLRKGVFVKSTVFSSSHRKEVFLHRKEVFPPPGGSSPPTERVFPRPGGSSPPTERAFPRPGGSSPPTERVFLVVRKILSTGAARPQQRIYTATPDLDAATCPSPRRAAPAAAIWYGVSK